MEFVGGAVAVVQHTAELKQCPGGLRRFITVGPVGRETVVGIGIDQLQAAAAAIRPLAPATAFVVSDLIDGDMDRVGNRYPVVRDDDLVRHGQSDSFAGVGKVTAEVTERVVGGQPDIIGQQAEEVVGSDDVSIGRDDRVRGKGKGNAITEPPAGQTDWSAAAVVKFHVFVSGIAGDGVEHDFVDDYGTVADGGVGCARRFGGQTIKARRAVRKASGGHAILLTFETDGVDDFGVGWIFQINRFAFGAERKAKIRLVVNQEPARRNRGAGGNDKFVGARIVRDDAAGDAHCLSAVVEQLDVIELRIIGVGEEFVDQNRAIRIGGSRFGCFRSAAKDIAGVPGLRIVLAIGRARQDERVSRVVGGDRPGGVIGVVDFQHDEVRFVAQSHRS